MENEPKPKRHLRPEYVMLVLTAAIVYSIIFVLGMK